MFFTNFLQNSIINNTNKTHIYSVQLKIDLSVLLKNINAQKMAVLLNNR